MLAVRELEVVGEVPLLCECFVAFIAFVWPLARVDLKMSLPVSLVVKAFVAHTASVVDLVFVLYLSVCLESGPRPIRPITLTALECFGVSVLLFTML